MARLDIAEIAPLDRAQTEVPNAELVSADRVYVPATPQ